MIEKIRLPMSDNGQISLFIILSKAHLLFSKFLIKIMQLIEKISNFIVLLKIIGSWKRNRPLNFILMLLPLLCEFKTQVIQCFAIKFEFQR
jgi:hypothetical protein